VIGELINAKIQIPELEYTKVQNLNFEQRTKKTGSPFQHQKALRGIWWEKRELGVKVTGSNRNISTNHGIPHLLYVCESYIPISPVKEF